MAKKTTTLSAAQYWEWRTTISEMFLAQQKSVSAELHLKFMLKEAELSSVRSQLFNVSEVQSAKQNYESAKTEYERFKKVLEDSLSVSLSGKMIDEITFEIKDLPKEQ